MDSIVDILERSGAEIDTDSLFDVILTEAGSNESFVPVEVSGLNLIIPDECQELVGGTLAQISQIESDL